MTGSGTEASPGVAAAEAAAAVAALGQGAHAGWREERYSDGSFSLGQLLIEALRTEYEPALRARAMPSMAGCLVVSGKDLEEWAQAQKNEQDG